MEGSRSGGLLAATWASMVPARPRGLPRLRRGDLRDLGRACRTRCAPTPSCASSATPTFLFSFTSDEFDIYHVNDFMRERGWRFNGQQYPNALHMAVTRPQTQPGVAEAFAADLADAVAYAVEHAGRGAAVGRHLRRRGRRHDRRGRRVHPGGHGRHDGRTSRPCPAEAGSSPARLTCPTDAGDVCVLAVDLGTGGPKVGLVSLTGAIAWRDHIPVETRRSAGGGAVQDAERVVGRHRRRHPPGRLAAGSSTRARSWRCRAPASGRAPCPWTRPACRSATA